MAMLTSQAGIAFAAAGPMFKLLAERAVRTQLSLLFDLFAAVAYFLRKEAVALFLRRVLFRGTWITIAVTVFIAIFDDDALEKWCKHTVYRGPKFNGEKPYKTTAEELGSLYGALQEVI